MSTSEVRGNGVTGSPGVATFDMKLEVVPHPGLRCRPRQRVLLKARMAARRRSRRRQLPPGPVHASR